MEGSAWWFCSLCSNEKPDMSSALSMLLLMSAFVCAVRGQMNPPLPKCQMGLLWPNGAREPLLRLCVLFVDDPAGAAAFCVCSLRARRFLPFFLS